MSRITSRTSSGMSTHVDVRTSPAMCTCPVVIIVSTATRLVASSFSIASRIASLIWSAILSGCPSVTDSEVNRRRDTGLPGDSRGVAAGGRYPSLAVEAHGHGVPHRVCDGVLAGQRDLGGGAVGTEDDGGIVRGVDGLVVAHLVDHEEAAPRGGAL